MTEKLNYRPRCHTVKWLLMCSIPKNLIKKQRNLTAFKYCNNYNYYNYSSENFRVYRHTMTVLIFVASPV